MIIKTKYNLGETVFFIAGSKIISGEVRTIWYRKVIGQEWTRYEVVGSGILKALEESELFSTREALIASL